ncbi:PLP-dependent aminotransferase family protein [Vibrio marisflavi]|nr:PLP-dependent aminotransferase family protein [Vibrio marisflavi]
MPLIDIGDLQLSNSKGAKQTELFKAIREKIVEQLWPIGGKLPSTRKLAEELSLSRNTVTNTYEQLVAEGYIESRAGSGFYVCIELPEAYLPAPIAHSAQQSSIPPYNNDGAFASGVPDLNLFPIKKWQRLLQQHSSRVHLLGSQHIQGSIELRSALSDYLATSRSVVCNPSRIIITSGAQQALSIALMATLSPSDSILMEQPGYTQMSKIINLLGSNFIAAPVVPKLGLDIDLVLQSNAKALYITPSNQYPLGTSLDTKQRLSLIEWAVQGNSWIIEDDYDSEFQFAHRPYTSMQGLAGQMGRDEHVIYVGSFSKVMFNSLRLGYLVVPESLISKCLTIKDAITGDSPAHVQAALADFIREGDLIRHVRKMRRLYKLKHQAMIDAIKLHLPSSLEVVSQAAGMHITLKWHGSIDEQDLVDAAQKVGLNIRPMSYYEHNKNIERDWNAVILGFGNVSMDDIPQDIARLASLFHC